MIRKLALLVVPFMLAATEPACDPKPVELTIFHTNDLHSRLRASKNDPFELGGLARMKTLLTELRSKAPVSLTIDAGDWSEGSWYFSVDAGANMLRFMDKLGFDAVCVGNHDFLAGPDELITAVRAASPALAVLAANFDVKKYARGQELAELVPAYTIREVGGLKVGIIGISIESGVFDSYLEPVELDDPVASAIAVAYDLRPKVDVMIITSHNDIEVNRRLAREVPGVDAVISGHTHIKTPRAFIEHNSGREVPVVETGYWGKFLGELKLEVYPPGVVGPQGRVRPGRFKLHPVGPGIPEDAEVAAMVTVQDQILGTRYGMDVHEVVGHTEHELRQIDNTESTLGNLAAKSYRALTGAEAGIEISSLIGIGIAEGPVTVMDLHDVIPHTWNPRTGKEWTVHVWNATGSDLSWLFTSMFVVTGILPKSAPLGWPNLDGIEIAWWPIFGKEALNVRKILVNGEPLDKNRRYRVAITDGLIRALNVASSILPHDFDLSQVENTGVEAWQAVLRYGSVPGNLALENLRIGKAVKTTGQDLAVQSYGIARDADGLVVEVENLGNKSAEKARLRCSSGKPNDLIVYGTDEQKWTKIGDAKIPKLEPGASARLRIGWDPAVEGYWPIKCSIDRSVDRYHVNDSASKVFKIGL
ncbi:MAG TPA: metallophosphoesterase [Bdellovibrionota bacterium]|nr:metallophosphoesterase [Bdellovibrionota bacterium]